MTTLKILIIGINYLQLVQEASFLVSHSTGTRCSLGGKDSRCSGGSTGEKGRPGWRGEEVFMMKSQNSSGGKWGVACLSYIFLVDAHIFPEMICRGAMIGGINLLA